MAKAQTDLFNKASKVVLVRDEEKTVVTMSNDYQGKLKEFAIVIPVPEVLKRKQIHIGQQKVVDHLDSYTAPRLVEYFDKDPCRSPRLIRKMGTLPILGQKSSKPKKEKKSKLGVKIEAKYTVGEYDILILSAKQSNGLFTWLNREGYKLPKGAKEILGSYIKQDLKFFVAKVNLKKQAKLGYKFLRPIQIAYESEKFMLPIRLGTLNSKGHQDLFVFALTRKGRVELKNYRTVKIPSNMDIPVFVKNEFNEFYKDMFSEQVRKENMKVAFLEYAWDMGWCDPCAADPLSEKELKSLGVFWNQSLGNGSSFSRGSNVYVTRLHLRYTAKTFPEDLFFQVTSNRKNYQGRYVLRHKWKGEAKSCKRAEEYKKALPERHNREAENLARLTAWDINEIRKKMKLNSNWGGKKPLKKWYETLWE